MDGANFELTQKEFEIRFGIVMLFHYINEEHIDSLLAYADLFKHEAYYARMAMAWMISICFIKFPQKTMKYLQQSKLDDWTYNKAIQKTIESLRINKETKDTLRTMTLLLQATYDKKGTNLLVPFYFFRLRLRLCCFWRLYRCHLL